MLFGWIMVGVWILTVIGWIIYNLYSKNEKLESTVLIQANFITSIQALISQSDKALKELDDKIWLESDKELLTVFQNLKAVQEALNQYNKG